MADFYGLQKITMPSLGFLQEPWYARTQDYQCNLALWVKEFYVNDLPGVFYDSEYCTPNGRNYFRQEDRAECDRVYVAHLTYVQKPNTNTDVWHVFFSLRFACARLA